ncbi:MAG: CehA/McbA family metallohydrolase [Myxococcota bacterium]
MSYAARVVLAASAAVLLSTCSSPGGGGPSVNPKRCVVDLKATGLFAQEGTGASARVIDSEAQLIGGQTATATLGDVLMQNDKVRVVVEKPGRTVGPTLYGGGIIDADLVRGAGEAGRDQFGRMALAYSFGRVTRVTDVEVLSDGSAGGPAVVAVSGDDVPHDLLNLKAIVSAQLGNVSFVVDPEVALPVRVTTYYVLSPGETRVRMLTAFCNDGESPVSAPLIDLTDFRGSVEFFNPDGCANALGTADCLLDPSRWVGAHGDGVSYGLRSYQLADPTKPVVANATMGYGGVVGSVVEGESLNGVLTWTDPEARTRPGTFLIRGGQSRSYLRDLVIARDLAGVSSTWLELDGAPSGVVNVTATLSGAPVEAARVSVVDVDNDRLVTVVETEASGKGQVRLAPGTYRLSAAKEGHLVGPVAVVTVTAGGTHDAAVTVEPSRTLTVKVASPAGAPMPAKVTVRCLGPCPFGQETWKNHYLLEKLPGSPAAIGFVPASGRVDVKVPPGRYEVVVSRGPEFNLWPDTYPLGQQVDLTTADATVDATLERVVDSTGWQSADFHVHAINSTDSLVPNEVRVASFLAEGVDVLISTDHEVITDYAPVIRDLGASELMASLIGEEVTSFTYGHFNSVNLTRDATKGNGGAFDHAGGEGPTLRLTELFPGIKAAFPGAFVQINHPRGAGGALTQLKVDTATLATHADPADFRMAPAPDATASNTKLFGDGFDGVEVANGGSPQYDVVNDWMTFLSRGTVRTATGVSDTHKAFADVGGYSRTWVQSGVDAPKDFSPAGFAEAARAHKVFIGNGPFLSVTARRLTAGGQPVGADLHIGDTVSVNVGAGEKVELVADVQAPEWVQFDRIEVYTHTSGREAVNGESNGAWPESRIHQKQELDPANLTLEAVPGTNARRVHVTARFELTPTADTWYVVMVRSVGSSRTMSPLDGSRPWAMSNAILVDADGTGAYDDFPIKGQALSVAPKPVKDVAGPRRVPSAEEFAKALDRVLHCDHGRH